ncbi:Ig-like domain-containing protein [Ruania rhizosphaerae]|uniref:Ig-like domain-containing protein n=1 Tax=Ruania rhizosphaerae TaxID=1840413 RepID=UPI00135964AA|nr:Ig-like domain-containing protein [Ruania rhizosphaerae]
MTADIQVLLHDGTYYLEDSLHLDEQDSGRDGHTITWTNADGATPELVGGKPIEGTWEATDHPDIQRIHLPEVAAGEWTFEQVFVDGERQTKARFPNDGYLYTEGTPDGWRDFRTQGDLPAWSPPAGAQVTIWTRPFFMDTIEIATIDQESNTVTVSEDLFRPIRQDDNARYFVQGFREALDSPGEFFLDESDGYLYYWPTSDLSTSTIVAPTTDRIISLHGSTPELPIENVRIEGLQLSTSSFTRYFSETHDIEWNRPADDNTPGIIYIENAQDIGVVNNNISNAGLNGVSLHRYAQDITVSGNEISGAGYHGILAMGTISGTFDGNGDQVYDNRSNLISNNYLHHDGDLVGHAGGIFLHQSGENIVEHNVIHDMPRYGIGAKGGRFPDMAHELTSRDNIVRYNDISRVLQNSDDAGGITFTTTGPGNVIENNRIHDYSAELVHRGPSYGIYLDNENTYATARFNVIHDIGAPSDSSHHGPIAIKGHYNSLENNFLIENSHTPSAMAIANMQHGNNDAVAHRYTRNVSYLESDGAAFYDFLNYEPDSLEHSDDNVFYHVADEYRVTGLSGVLDGGDWLLFRDSQFDQHSEFTDPQFRDPESGDYTLSPFSPAFALGIENIDLSQIGTTTDRFDAGPLARLHATAGEDPTQVALEVGTEADLEIVARDEHGLLLSAEDYAVTFTSADPTVATVDATGRVSGHSVGATAITASATADGATVEVSIPVLVGDTPSSISVTTDEEATLAVDQETSLRTIQESTMGIVDLLDPDNVTFTSSNSAVASVTDAVVTAHQTGQATITATVDTGSQTLVDTIEIAVKDRVLDTLDAQNSALGIAVGATASVDVTGTWSDGSSIDPSVMQVTYSSSDQSVATVNSEGTINGLAPGTARIRVAAEVDGLEVTTQTSAYVVGESPAPTGWTSTEVGTWSDPETYLDYDDGRFTLATNARDAWGTADAAHLVHRTVSPTDYPDGFSLTATLESVSQVHVNSMAGLMIRDDLASSSVVVAPRVRPGGAMPVGVRSETGSRTTNVSGNPYLSFPATLRLTYRDGLVTSSYLDGTEWIESGQATLDLGETIEVGIWNAAFDTAGISQATFTDVQLEPLDPEPAAAETLATLENETTIATAYLATSVTGDDTGEYPAGAVTDLQGHVDHANDVLDLGSTATENQVSAALSVLRDGLQVFNDSRHAPLHTSLDFNDEPIGEMPEGLRTFTPENGETYIVEDGYSDSQSLQIDSSATLFHLLGDLPPGSGQLTYTMRFRPDQTTAQFIVRLSAADRGEQALHLWFVNNGSIRIVDADGNRTKIGTYDADRWHELDVHVDTTTQMLDVELNGDLLASDVPFRHPVASIETVEWQAGPGTFWVDSLRASTEGHDTTLATLTMDTEPLEGFDPSVTDYVVELAPGDPLPTVDAATTDADASLHISPAQQRDGTTSVVVISDNRRVHTIYTVAFVCGTHSDEEVIAIGSSETDVPNYQRVDGCTFMDVLDDRRPFDQNELVHEVRTVALDWMHEGHLAPLEYVTLIRTAIDESSR